MGLQQLTFLRFIAASAVVIFHFGREVPSLSWGSIFWPNANTAVSFFFVLSGFILAHVYDLRGVRSPRDFYVARLARIAPAYWCALVTVAIYFIFKHRFDLTTVFLSLTMLQAWIPGYALTLNSPGWSLSVEIFFYLLFPNLLKALQGIQRTTVLLAILIGSWAFNQILHFALMSNPSLQTSTSGHEFTAYNPITHVATFIVGVIGGLLFNAHLQALQRIALLLLVVSGFGLSLLFLTANPIVHLHHNGLAAPLFLTLIWGFGALKESPLVKLLCKRPLVLLGESSYAVYILQYPVFIAHAPFASRIHLGVEAAFWSYFLLLILVSLGTLFIVERPFRVRITAAFSGSLRTPH